MSAPELPDWAQSVQQGENVVQLLDAGLALGNLHLPYTSIALDTSQCNSISVYVRDTGGGSTSFVLVDLHWYEGTQMVGTDTFTVWSDGAATQLGATIRTPVKGSQVAVQLTSSDNVINTGMLGVWGSTRILSAVDISQNFTPTAQPLYNTGALSVAASSSVDICFGPVARAIAMRISPNANPVTYSLNAAGRSQTGSINATFGLWLLASPASYTNVQEIICPGMALHMILQNTDTVPRTMNFTAWDVS